MRACEHCGRPLGPSRQDRRFCDASCRVASHRAQERELAERLGISTGALLRWTRAGKVPAVKLPSGAVRYRPEQIDAWLDEHATAAAGPRKCHLPRTPPADGR